MEGFQNSCIQPYSFEPVYGDGECSSNSDDDSDLEGNEDINRVGNTPWCECEKCTVFSEKECVCCQEWDILHDRLEGGVDCVTDHQEFATICMNEAVLATAYVAFMRFKGIGGRAPNILDSRFVIFRNISSDTKA